MLPLCHPDSGTIVDTLIECGRPWISGGIAYATTNVYSLKSEVIPWNGGRWLLTADNDVVRENRRILRRISVGCKPIR